LHPDRKVSSSGAEKPSYYVGTLSFVRGQTTRPWQCAPAPIYLKPIKDRIWAAATLCLNVYVLRHREKRHFTVPSTETTGFIQRPWHSWEYTENFTRKPKYRLENVKSFLREIRFDIIGLILLSRSLIQWLALETKDEALSSV